MVLKTIFPGCGVRASLMLFLKFDIYFWIYFLIKIEDGTQKELFPTGSKHQEPTVTKLDNDRLAVGRDDMTIFIDYEGNPTQKYALSWSEMPLAMGKYPSQV